MSSLTSELHLRCFNIFPHVGPENLPPCFNSHTSHDGLHRCPLFKLYRPSTSTVSTRAPAPQHVPTLVIGAGIHGLSAAHIFHRCAPHTPILILDANASIGGVWAKENIYPGLKSNNIFGSYEYTGFPMKEGEWGVKSGEHIPGTVMHAYLTKFAEWTGLSSYVRLRTRVLSAEELDGGESGWRVRCVEWDGAEDVDGKGKEYEISSERLIVATGITSAPVSMHIAGADSFGAPILNFAGLSKAAPGLFEDQGLKHVTVYGGSKAAYGCVYCFASAGKKVS